MYSLPSKWYPPNKLGQNIHLLRNCLCKFGEIKLFGGQFLLCRKELFKNICVSIYVYFYFDVLLNSYMVNMVYHIIKVCLFSFYFCKITLFVYINDWVSINCYILNVSISDGWMFCQHVYKWENYAKPRTIHYKSKVR